MQPAASVVLGMAILLGPPQTEISHHRIITFLMEPNPRVGMLKWENLPFYEKNKVISKLMTVMRLTTVGTEPHFPWCSVPS